MTETWHKQPEETAKAYKAFSTYRDMPILKRSIDKAYKQYKNSTKMSTHWRVWSTKYDWISRVSDYDAYNSDSNSKAIQSARLENKVKRITKLSELLDLGSDILASLTTADSSHGDAIRAIDIAVKHLRAEFDDEATQKIQSAKSGDVIVKVIKGGPDGVSFDDL